MNKITRQRVSQAVAQLMPNIIRGIQLDFFVKRRVTQTQLLMLLAIHAYRTACMGRLAQSLHVSQPTATGIVSRLLRAGYVRRLEDAEDRRHVMVALTPKGEEFIRAFQAVIRHRWADVLKTLEPTELEAFYRVVTKLQQQLRVVSS